MSDYSPEEALDQHFLEKAGALGVTPSAPRTRPVDPAAPEQPDSRLTGGLALALFDAQLGNRHLNLAARYLRAAGHRFYTIGSSGHEANAAVAARRGLRRLPPRLEAHHCTHPAHGTAG